MNFSSFFFLSVVVLCMGLPARAELTARLTKHGSNKSTLDWSAFRVSGGAAERLFLQTLQNDLKLSGCFINKSASPAEYRIVGSAAANGPRLTVQISAVDQLNSAIYGQAFEHQAQDAQVRDLAHRIADELVEKLAGQKGIAQARIALIGTASNRKELYLAGSDGQGIMQITNDQSLSLSPNWSQDGRSLVYTSYLMGYPDIYRITLNTGKRERISNFPGLNTGGALSPDGQNVALVLSKDGKPELYVKNLPTGRVTRLTKTRSSPKASPSWSPDGNRIVFVSGHEGGPLLYTISRSGGRVTPLRVGGVENVAPNWGPDGRICYASRVGRDQYGIRIYDPAAQGNKVTEVTSGQAGSFEDPSWASNGRHIYCSRKVNYRSSIYLLDTLGDPPIALISSGKGDWYTPKASP